MVVDLAAIIVAIISLIVSIYVIRRDKKKQQLENLINFRQRLLDIHTGRDVLTLKELTKLSNDQSEKAEKWREKNKNIQFKLEQELDLACYLVLKGEINSEHFLDVFNPWIKGRSLSWTETQKENRSNYKNTWKLIKIYKKKRLL